MRMFNACVYVCGYVCVDIYIYLYIYMYICIYVLCMYICTYVIIGSCDPLSELCCTCVTLIPKISNASHAEDYK